MSQGTGANQVAGVGGGADDASPSPARALSRLAEILQDPVLPYALPGSTKALSAALSVADQLGDYLLPRLASLDAPLLAVVGGSTGAGKSTLVSSLVGRRVAASSAIRPTTRRPLLLHAPTDAPWFADSRVLGSLPRIRVDEDAPATPASTATARELEIRACSALPAGLALLDAPDVDSVVDDNRDLAATLLASADLWVFVTTAARYADAVPWGHLREAAGRNVVVAVVLDRVPHGAAAEVEADLRRRLDEAGLDGAPLFTVGETVLGPDGLLSEPMVAPLRQWLEHLAADAAARRGVALRTLVGAAGSALTRLEAVARALAEQERERERLDELAAGAHADAAARVDAATEDGLMLRGEVLARWQELVGTGELLRGLEAQVGRWRDRLVAAVRGRPAPAVRVEEAIESSLATLLVAEAQRAGVDTERAWRRQASGQDALDAALARLPEAHDLQERAVLLTRGWQRAVLDMVRQEGAGKRLTARLLSLGVNAVGVALMVVVFAHTGGLTGGELGIAGGTAVVAQRLLEAVFGDQAMRSLAQRSRADLARRTHEFFAHQQAVFHTSLAIARPASEQLRVAIGRARAALASTQLAPEEMGRHGGHP